MVEQGDPVFMMMMRRRLMMVMMTTRRRRMMMMMTMTNLVEQGNPVLEKHLGSSWVAFQTHKPIKTPRNSANPQACTSVFKPILKFSLLANLTKPLFSSEYTTMLLKLQITVHTLFHGATVAQLTVEDCPRYCGCSCPRDFAGSFDVVSLHCLPIAKYSLH